MRESSVLTIALAGNPNCGKTALFNTLTGSHQKVANYPGVTVEKKEGYFFTASHKKVGVIDLPGTYSLHAITPDEKITRDVLEGKLKDEITPDYFVAVVDATHLERSLGLVLEIQQLGKPIVLALNMMDLARSRGLDLDINLLSQELKAPVIPTVAIQRSGIEKLIDFFEREDPTNQPYTRPKLTSRERFQEVDRILKKCIRKEVSPSSWTERIDRIVLHPLWGVLIFFAVVMLLFQAVFNWASVPQDWIRSWIAMLGQGITAVLGEGPLQSLLVDGVIAGVGSVIVFLPQILILFTFILALEDFGYLSRAAFLMDKLMGKAGLNGRAFIPLISSYACAIPGIMATRTIANPRDRLVTILIAPLTTCSARLPVYSLLIAAFIPNTAVWSVFRLQGLVLFSLYFLGIIAAIVMAVIFRKTLLQGPTPALILELPSYQVPHLKNLVMGLYERSKVFIRRAGTVILSISILLWILSTYPKPPEGFAGAPILASYAGRIGQFLEPIFKPIGFNWQIVIALIPGFAAREVMVGALATVYAVSSDGAADVLPTLLPQQWSLATALSLLVWYVLACQCMSTLAVTRRETNSWKWPFVMLGYMTILAYLSSFATYHAALYFGLG